ncbi:MAG: hypothetical protein CMF52_00420 [Legionellales bacterium]|nr:hypothetical protein [Legionellales bacterium]
MSESGQSNISKTMSDSSDQSNISYDEEDGHLKVEVGDSIGPWTVVDRIGIGQYGMVWTVKNDTKVLKIMRSGEDHRDMINSEIEILQSLTSDYIMQLDSTLDHANQDRIHKVLVMERMEKDLFTLLHEDEKVLTHTAAARMIRQLLRGVAALEEAKIVHLDLKPENILLQGDMLKIADFGTAQRLPMKEIPLYGKTTEYRALEVIMDLEDCNAKADVWSAACVIYEIVTRMHGQTTLLFEPREVSIAAEDLEDMDEEIDLNHLYLIQEVLGQVPKHMHRHCQEYFTVRGELRGGIGKVVLRSLDELMVEDGIEDVDLWMDFFTPMLRYNPKKRFSALDMVDHKCLAPTKPT